MKRRDLIKQIREAAKEADLSWESLRARGDHEVFSLDGLRIAVPQHREINEITAMSILKQAGDRLGEEWWK